MIHCCYVAKGALLLGISISLESLKIALFHVSSGYDYETQAPIFQLKSVRICRTLDPCAGTGATEFGGTRAQEHVCKRHPEAHFKKTLFPRNCVDRQVSNTILPVDVPVCRWSALREDHFELVLEGGVFREGFNKV